MSATCDIITVFQIYGQFVPTGSRIPGAYFVKLTFSLRGDTHMTTTLRGGLWMLSDVRGWGISKCFERPNWIGAMTRHHAEPKIYI